MLGERSREQKIYSTVIISFIQNFRKYKFIQPEIQSLFGKAEFGGLNGTMGD